MIRRHRISTYAALVGHDFPFSRRVQITPVFGLGIADHADQGRTTFTPPVATFSGPVTFDDRELVFTASFGADVAVALTSRVGLVPQLRVHALVGPEGAAPILRPGIAIRVGL
jgi:hypothetical protein